MENAISIRGVSKSFHEKQVLKEISIEIQKGEVFGLLGPSGAGKTTLIKLITGQLKADRGEIRVLGLPVTERAKIYSQMGAMLDDSGVYERLSCYDNLKLFTDIHGIPKSRIREVLRQVGLDGEGRTAASSLSKGMRQRLIFARAILQEPKLLFMDEPTGALDPAMTAEIHGLIREQKEKGATIFLTTHNMVEASKLCDHIALIHQGKIVEYGEPDALCRKFNELNQIQILFKNGEMLTLANSPEAADTISSSFRQGEVESIHSTEPDLETVFMKLTGRSLVKG